MKHLKLVTIQLCLKKKKKKKKKKGALPYMRNPIPKVKLLLIYGEVDLDPSSIYLIT